MKMLIRVVLALAVVWTAAPLAAPRSDRVLPPLFVRAQAQAAQAPTAALPASPDLPKPNYQLAAQWRADKVGRYVFSRAVTPHWLEFSDRFW
jgi:hypothetical protein